MLNFLSSIIFSPIRSALITPLWMMHYIFFGTFLIIPTLLCTKSINRKRDKYLFLLFMMLILYKYNEFYMSVLLGVFIYNLSSGDYIRLGEVKYLFLLGLVGSSFFETNVVHILRAILILCILMTYKSIQKTLCMKGPQLLNDISYPLYLIHVPVICSLSCWIYMKWDGLHITLIFLATLLLVIFLAYFLSKIDKKISVRLNSLCNGIIK